MTEHLILITNWVIVSDANRVKLEALLDKCLADPVN